MLKAIRSAFLVLLFMGVQTSIAQAETIKIISFPIPLMVESANKGVFIDLVKEIDNRIDYDVEISVFPTKRTVKMFHEEQTDGFFPALDVILSKDTSKSSNIYTKKDFGFVKQGSKAPESIADLNGKSIGLTNGYPYVTEITTIKTAKTGFAGTDEKNVQKLLAGRIDVFIVEEKSGLKAIQNANATDSIVYNKDKPLSQQDVFFAFQNTASGKKHAEAFSSALQAMQADGTFGKIMSQANQ